MVVQARDEQEKKWAINWGHSTRSRNASNFLYQSNDDERPCPFKIEHGFMAPPTPLPPLPTRSCSSSSLVSYRNVWGWSAIKRKSIIRRIICRLIDSTTSALNLTFFVRSARPQLLLFRSITTSRGCITLERTSSSRRRYSLPVQIAQVGRAEDLNFSWSQKICYATT